MMNETNLNQEKVTISQEELNKTMLGYALAFTQYPQTKELAENLVEDIVQEKPTISQEELDKTMIDCALAFMEYPQTKELAENLVEDIVQEKQNAFMAKNGQTQDIETPVVKTKKQKNSFTSGLTKLSKAPAAIFSASKKTVTDATTKVIDTTKDVTTKTIVIVDDLYDGAKNKIGFNTESESDTVYLVDSDENVEHEEIDLDIDFSNFQL